MNDEWVDDPAPDAPDEWQDDAPHESASFLESLGRGAGQGATFGLQDEASAGLEKAMIKIHNLFSEGKIDEPTYNELRDNFRADNQAAQQDNPGAYMAGEIGGAVASTAIPGAGALNIGKGAKVGEVVAKSAAAGGLGGFGYSNADNAGDLAVDTGVGAGLGSIFGLGGKAAEKGLEKIASLSPKLREMASSRAAKALGAGKNQFKKDALKRTLEMGDMALEEGIVTPFASTKKMLERSEAARKAAGEAQGEVYNIIDSKGASTFNPLDAAVQAESDLSPTYRTPINKGEWSQLDNTIESMLARGADDIPLKEAQLLKEEIGSVAYPKGKRPLDPTPKQQMAEDAYLIVRDRINKASEDAADKIGLDAGLTELPATLKKANKTYGLASDGSRLLDNKQAQEDAAGGLYNTVSKVVDYAALGAAPFTGGVSLKGLALKKGIEAVADKRNQIAATGLKVSSNLVKMFPNISQQLYKGTRTLSGTDSVLPDNFEFRKAAEDLSQTDDPAATHYLMMQRDPQYRLENKGK